MAGRTCALAAILGITALAACDRSTLPAITVDPRLHADVLGCWRLSLDRNAGPIMTAPNAAMQMRLDSASLQISTRTGARVLRRLNADGVPLETDADGIPLRDAWEADAIQPRVRLQFDNGRVGSTWLLDVATDSLGMVGLTGVSQAFDRAKPDAKFPPLRVLASRIGCSSP
jgi:hypothetical protein